MLTRTYPKDRLGRRFRKLRISLLDACNFKCSYCMPPGPEFMRYDGLLTPLEIGNIVKALKPFGIEEVRLTGGEPLLRKDIVEVIENLSSLELKKLAMTTNAFSLHKKLPSIYQAGLKSFNISLDTLERKKFREVTKVDGLNDVLKSIEKVKEIGGQVKVNTVLLKGVNDDEIQSFLDFSKKYDIEVRFLEVMKIGVMVDKYEKEFISAGEIISRLKKKYHLKRKNDEWDSTSMNFELDNGAKIGFIASESMPFCGGCSRLRLGAKGKLYSCLMSNYGHELKSLSHDELNKLLQDLILNKPQDRIEKIERPMYQIGG